MLRGELADLVPHGLVHLSGRAVVNASPELCIQHSRKIIPDRLSCARYPVDQAVGHIDGFSLSPSAFHLQAHVLRFRVEATRVGGLSRQGGCQDVRSSAALLALRQS